MKCDKLEEYLDGDLEGEELSGFREHLEGCPRCALEVNRQERLDRALSEASQGLAAPVGLIGHIEGEIETLEARRLTLRRWTAAAALLVVGLGAGLLLIDRGEGPSVVKPRAPEETAPSSPVIRQPAPDANPIATVKLSETSKSLAVPVATREIDATIVFVYPVLASGRPQDFVE